MISKSKYGILFGALILCMLLLCFLELITGSYPITFQNIIDYFILSGEHEGSQIISDFRIPRMVMALVAGGGLSIAGLLMQTLFSNPLAGPYVLGINSGSSLLVALALLSGIPFFASDLGIISGAVVGAFLVGLLILFIALYVRSSVTLLLVGLMIGSFCGAFVTVLQSYSSAESLKIFTMWSFGTLQNTSLDQIPVIISVFAILVLALFFLIKPLNAYILGERNALNLGISIKRTRILLIILTSGFTGLVTAYCGPIAFVGLAVPNLTRILMKTQNHRILIPATLLVGCCFLLLCDLIIKLFENQILIPINALTSLVGAPFVIFLILKRKV